MAKATDGELIIESWSMGIAPHPVLGFGNMSCVDISTNPGSVRLNQLMTKVSGSTVTDLIIGFRRDPKNTNSIWAYGDTAKVYHSTDDGTTWSVVTGNSSGIGEGIGLWQDYLWVATSSTLDVYGPLSNSPTWTTNFQTLTTDLYHTMLESVDNDLYICNHNTIARVQWQSSIAPFDPANASSFVWVPDVCILPSDLRTKSIADLGQFLMVGTWKGSNIYEFKVADLYPFARPALTIGIPLRMNENGVNAMLSLNNRLYIQAGIEGKIFESDSTSFIEISKIPNYVNNLDGGAFIFTNPGAMIYHRGKIFFGVSGCSTNGGVYSLYPSTGKNVLQLENLISTGTDTGVMGALLSTNRDIYLNGWKQGSTYGIDKMDNQHKYTFGFIDSPLYEVGESLGNRTFQQMENYFTKLLVSGQGINIKYRKNLSDSFTTLGSYTFSTEGGVLSFNKSASVITSSVFIQFRIELTNGTSNLSPELKRLMFKLSL
jgi:hypothetical protein